MAFDWSSLIDLAAAIHQQAASAANPEACWRTAVNRAYYGAFGHANRYAVQLLQYQARGEPDEHGRLREHLRRKRRKGAAERLNSLRELRNHADYLNELPWHDINGTVILFVELARQVLAALPPPPKS